MERQDRIDLHKTKRGIASGPPGKDELQEGIPVIRAIEDNSTGEQKTVQYVKNGNTVVSSDFNNIADYNNNYSAKWNISGEVDLSSTGTTKALFVPGGTYVLDIKILVTFALLGSYDVDVGDGGDSDRFIDGWNGSNAGDTNQYSIVEPGTTDPSPDTESGQQTGKHYNSDDTIDVVVNTAPTTGKIKLLVFMLNNPIHNDWS
tara:strand:+ start:253 stop:861 length:609 start_codon:yes stop_codon:yes gene_type:complete